MAVKAMVFPGQGAQKVGMAKDFYEQHAAAREIFEQADRLLPFDIKALCFEANDDIHQTQYTQPAILTAEVAIYESLRSVHGEKRPASFFAGHSLGEYAALVAAGVMPFEIALQVVARRATLMQAVAVAGGMAAVLMEALPVDTLAKVAKAHDIDIANHNSPQQVVISGQQPNLSEAVEAVQQALGADSRVVMLKVSAPFHSRHMREAQEEFAPYLASFTASLDVTHAPTVLSNFTGVWHQAQPQAIIDALVQQLSGQVRWQQNMDQLLAVTRDITELGPSRPLSGFFRAMDVEVKPICRLKQLTQWLDCQ